MIQPIGLRLKSKSPRCVKGDRRSSKDVAFVRTGLGGEKVVISGGALVLPIVHNVTKVGMNTLRLEVRRAAEKALITRNRMRIDVVCEFYLRVGPNVESVSIAAQTLGRRTLDAENMKDLVQGRLTDALSSVAAQMTMDEIQDKRSEYVKAVKTLVEEALSMNGLELEAVSLTGLDQASMEYFNPSNAFDAEGLTQLTEQIEKRKKQRNDIEQDTKILIRKKDLETTQQSLELERDDEYARMAQEREIAHQRAKERTDIAKNRADRDREAQEAEIQAQEDIEKARILRDKTLEAEMALRETTLTEEIEGRRKHRNEIEKNTEIEIRAKDLEAELRTLEIEREAEFARLQQQLEITKRRAQQTAEVARQKSGSERESELAKIEAQEAVERAQIALQTAIESVRIQHEQDTQTLDVKRRLKVEVEERDRTISLLKKDQEQSEVTVKVEEARAKAVSAEEKVLSVRETEVAERRKLIELIGAAKAVESEAIQLTTIAEAQKTAAERNAAAEQFKAATAKLHYEVNAEGKRLLHEAENQLSGDSRYHALRMKLVENLEAIIRESVKPMESINDIKILQVDGLPGLSGQLPSSGSAGGDGGDLDGPSSGGGGRNGGTLADNIVSSALRYRAQAPFVDNLLQEIGMSPNEISNLSGLLKDQPEAKK
mgnify:FL=1